MQYDIDGGNITVIVGEEARIDVPTTLHYIKSGQAEISAAVDAGIEAYNLNATDKTTAFNNNATDKTNAFDLNASGKTTDFNDNYTLKKAAVDASADAAAASATLAQQWAVKMDGKVADEDYSAKYYADLASQAAGATGANTDLSNLTPTGEAKFTAKQDVIDADHKLSYNYLSDTPDLSAYVTTNTAQTITGAKTFTGEAVRQLNSLSYGGFKVQNTQLEKGTTPSSSTGGQFYFQDKDGLDLANRIGGIESVYGTNGNIVTRLSACEPVADSTNYASVDVVYKSDGTTYATAPTPGASLNLYSTTIPTIGWVNTAGDSANNILHKTGDETITGRKVVKDNYFDFKMSDIAYSETPATNHYAGIDIIDKNNTQIGTFYLAKYSDGGGLIGMALKNKAGDSSGINLRYNSSNVFYTTAPASDAANSIVTTVNKSKAANGYFQLGNGLIVQWGSSVAATGSGDLQTITFPKAFTSTNYYAHANLIRNSATNAGWGYITSKSASSCKFVAETNVDTFTWIAIGY